MPPRPRPLSIIQSVRSRADFPHLRCAATVAEEQLRQALTVRQRCLVSRDGVVHLEGQLLEVRQGFLAGRRLYVCHNLVEGLSAEAWVEHDGHRYPLQPLDRRLNGTVRREHQAPAPQQARTPFEPSAPNPAP